MKALTDEQIATIRTRRRNGAKVMELAIEYHVHYRTIENYCKGIKRAISADIADASAESEGKMNYKKFQETLIKAKMAAIKAAKGDDGGTANLDTVTISLPRAREEKVIRAAVMLEYM
jgi:hypothetical protein